MVRLLGVDEADIKSIKGLSFEIDKVPDELDSFKSLVHHRLREKIKAIGAVLSKDDDLGKVVRAHIFVEHELHDFIFFAAPCPGELKRFEDIEYSEKLGLALVLGLNADLKPALKAAGALRNKFAHRLEMKIGEDEANNLMATLPPQAKQKCQVLLREMRSDFPSLSSLPAEGQIYFRAQTQLLAFFMQLLDMVAEERHRMAFERLQCLAVH